MNVVKTFKDPQTQPQIVLGMAFNCDMFCMVTLPSVPPAISLRALVKSLSIEQSQYSLGQLKMESLDILYSWIRQAMMFELCSGIVVPEKWKDLASTYDAPVLWQTEHQMFDKQCAGLYEIEPDGYGYSRCPSCENRRLMFLKAMEQKQERNLGKRKLDEISIRGCNNRYLVVAEMLLLSLVTFY